MIPVCVGLSRFAGKELCVLLEQLISLALLLLYQTIRLSRSKVFCQKRVLRNFVKFIGKRLCQSLIFNKVAGLGPGTLSKKRLWHWCFPVNFAKFLRAPFLTEHLRWLLLKPCTEGFQCFAHPCN